MQALVVVAHPCDDSFTHAAAERAVAGLRAGGHAVEVVDLYAIGFRVAMSTAERQAYEGETPLIDEHTREHARLVGWADCLVFVYPTWWSGQPAMLKGWLERVMVPGVAFVFDESNGKVRPGLRRVRRLVGISSYGSRRSVGQDHQRQRAAHDHCGRSAWHADFGPARHGSVCTASTRRTSHAGSSSSTGSRPRWRDSRERARRLLPSGTGLVRRIRARSGGRGARPTRERHARDRPVCRRVRPRLRCQRPAHPPRAGSRAGTAALRRRSALVRGVGARLPHLVERAAGDAEGLDRPGLGEWCGVVASRRHEPHPSVVAQRPPHRRRHDTRVLEARQLAAGRRRKARRHPRPALALQPPMPHDLGGDVRRRHVDG